MVRTLVTGASGYIGGRLVRELRARGVPVGRVARDPSRVSFDPAVTVHRADMLDPGSLSTIGEGYTTAAASAIARVQAPALEVAGPARIPARNGPS